MVNSPASAVLEVAAVVGAALVARATAGGAVAHVDLGRRPSVGAARVAPIDDAVREVAGQHLALLVAPLHIGRPHELQLRQRTHVTRDEFQRPDDAAGQDRKEGRTDDSNEDAADDRHKGPHLHKTCRVLHALSRIAVQVLREGGDVLQRFRRVLHPEDDPVAEESIGELAWAVFRRPPRPCKGNVAAIIEHGPPGGQIRHGAVHARQGQHALQRAYNHGIACLIRPRPLHGGSAEADYLGVTSRGRDHLPRRLDNEGPLSVHTGHVEEPRAENVEGQIRGEDALEHPRTVIEGDGCGDAEGAPVREMVGAGPHKLAAMLDGLLEPWPAEHIVFHGRPRLFNRLAGPRVSIVGVQLPMQQRAVQRTNSGTHY
mmetsp:Transcript_56211/g.162931  ORF Transcript_56211/g.162931 Transcript_56211/m.162931 type:complete len:372 (-) Transcript_56211:775-1890(-)